ncbi:MAG: hypothetical protein AB8H47_20980 [Bacteroidia bacterium]
MKTNIKLLIGILLLSACDQGLNLFPSVAPTGYVRMFGGTNDNEGEEIIYQDRIDAYTMIGSYGTEAFAQGQSINGKDMFLVQVDANGLRKWELVINEPSFSIEGKDLVAASPNAWLALGTASPTGDDLGANKRILLAHIIRNENGEFIQTIKWLGDGDYNTEAAGIEKDPQGGYIILGKTTRPSKGQTTAGIEADNHDLWLIKLDVNLDVLWERQYGFGDEEYPSQVRPVASGGYLVIAASVNPDKGLQSMMLRLDAQGNALQTRRIGESGYTFPKDIQIVDQDFYLLNASEEFLNNRLLGIATVGKYELNSLQLIWENTLQFTGTDTLVGPESLVVLNDGNIIVSGTVERNYEEELETKKSYDLFLTRLDAQGDNVNPAIWPSFYGDLPTDFAGRVLATPETKAEKGFLMVCTLGFGPTSMLGLISTDDNGQLTSQ